ncbi:hypothetical protein [Microbacterium lacticum]
MSALLLASSLSLLLIAGCASPAPAEDANQGDVETTIEEEHTPEPIEEVLPAPSAAETLGWVGAATASQTWATTLTGGYDVSTTFSTWAPVSARAALDATAGAPIDHPAGYPIGLDWVANACFDGLNRETDLLIPYSIQYDYLTADFTLPKLLPLAFTFSFDNNEIYTAGNIRQAWMTTGGDSGCFTPSSGIRIREGDGWSNVPPGFSITSYGFLVWKGFYSPDAPGGKTELLTSLPVQSPFGVLSEPKSWVFAPLTPVL